MPVSTPNDKLINAAKVKPPHQDGSFTGPIGYVETAVTAATASAAISTQISAAGVGWYGFGCTSTFNIVFDDDSTITNPTNSGIFPAGVTHFYLDTSHTHFKVTATANGYLTFWKSSYGSF